MSSRGKGPGDNSNAKRYPDLQPEIEHLLTVNPDGMSIIEISRELGQNRNRVANNLDVLCALGKVTFKAFGPAKVYFPASITRNDEK